MEPRFNTSFIPKESLTETAETIRRTHGGRPVGVVTFAAIIVFLAATVASVGLFLYEKFLNESIRQKSEQLTKAREAFEPALIEDLKHLDARLTSAGIVLANHQAASEVFALLEESTLATVRFNDFTYTAEGAGVKLAMRGSARSFNSVALQSDVFGNSRFLDEPIFSELNQDQLGKVTFAFNAVVEPSLVSYERRVTEEGLTRN